MEVKQYAECSLLCHIRPTLRAGTQLADIFRIVRNN